MHTNVTYLSLGVIPWLTIEDAVKFAQECGFAGIEVLPTRKIAKELTHQFCQRIHTPIGITTAHQSWRLDIGHDHAYGIHGISSAWYTLLRYLFFPKVEDSKKTLTNISNTLHIPITVHDLSDKWVLDSYGKEFSGGINLEILEDRTITKKGLKKWLKDRNHTVVVDTRDDQSLRWATYNELRSFSDFWTWIGLKKIHSIQLTLIGKKGIKNILDHRESLAEKELFWLHQKKWKGSVIIEINPFMLFIVTKGNVKKGLQTIALFINMVLNKGEKWSNGEYFS